MARAVRTRPSLVRIAILGVGAVGARAARQLASTPEVELVTMADVDPRRAASAEASIDDAERVRARPVGPGWAEGADVAILATPSGHRGETERLLEAGIRVVSAGHGLDEVRALQALDAEAVERNLAVVLGAGFGPGLTDVLAAHAASTFDAVDEIHITRRGTGGPACARQHHRALAGESVEWRDGAWVRRRAGSGRELVWFPDPVGPSDCYRASVPDPLLLVAAFPGVSRVSARVAANRRDRLTAHLPMLRPPHRETGLGAVRVEVRGRRGVARDVTVLGAIDRPAVAAGAVAALAALALARGEVAPGVRGLAGAVESVPFLAELARRGVKAAAFVGDAT
jgi:saccharopine dehydrogenase-like NADP-dependent oxidoreductase